MRPVYVHDVPGGEPALLMVRQAMQGLIFFSDVDISQVEGQPQTAIGEGYSKTANVRYIVDPFHVIEVLIQHNKHIAATQLFHWLVNTAILACFSEPEENFIAEPIVLSRWEATPLS